TATRAPASTTVVTRKWSTSVRSRDRQPDDEEGAARRSVRRRDRAAMALGDPLRDREAEPGATRRRAGGTPEAIEHVRQVLGLDPGALVRDGQVGLVLERP